MSKSENKCDKCILKITLQESIEETRKTQECYLKRIEIANKTIAKYTKKLDELEQLKKT